MQEEQLDVMPEDESSVEKMVQKTPWWAISVGAHTLALMVLSFLIVLGNPFQEPVVASVSPREPRELPVMTPPKDMTKKNPLDIKKKPVEDPIFRRVEESDHNETADEEEFEKAKGDSLDHVSDKPFQGRGTYDVVGGGGGGGGRYGQRLGGKKDLVSIGGGGEETEDAVMAALKWLARHQNPNGGWSVDGYTGRCNRKLPNGHSYVGGICSPNPGDDDYNVGVTGLSLLAFLGAGYSHLSQEVRDGINFGDVVRKGLMFLMKSQSPDGCIGPQVGHFMYNHAIASLALTEAYGLTGSNLLKDNAQSAVNYLVDAQNPGKGWRYSRQPGDNDTSVTGWAVMVLKATEGTGIEVERRSYDGARAWFDEVTEKGGYYGVGYTSSIDGQTFIPGKNRHFNDHPALEAISVMSRIFIDRDKSDPRIRGGCDAIVKDLPKWEKLNVDFYYWYYASLALFQYDGPKGHYWLRWNEHMKEALVKHQNARKTDCRNGSWEPVGRWSMEGGRVYSTAINALTLEVYYRYASVFGGDRK